MKKDIVVYVACSLTQAPIEFIKSVEQFKAKLSEICTVLKFVGLTDDPPNMVYQHDIINCVYKCDLLVAICDHPAIGLGYEMATQAEKRGKPILAVAHHDALVTKLILDIPLPGFEFRRYNNLCEDVSEMVKEKIKKM